MKTPQSIDLSLVSLLYNKFELSSILYFLHYKINKCSKSILEPYNQFLINNYGFTSGLFYSTY